MMAVSGISFRKQKRLSSLRIPIADIAEARQYRTAWPI